MAPDLTAAGTERAARSASHEAGHAVVASALGYRVTECRADTGNTALAIEGVPPLAHSVAILCAGEIAEELAGFGPHVPEPLGEVPAADADPHAYSDRSKLEGARQLGMTSAQEEKGWALARKLLADHDKVWRDLAERMAMSGALDGVELRSLQPLAGRAMVRAALASLLARRDDWQAGP